MMNFWIDSKSIEDDVIQIQSRYMSDPTLCDIDFKNKTLQILSTCARPKKKKSVKVSVKSKFLKLGLDNTIINSNGHNISRDKTMFTMSFYQSRFSRPTKKSNKSGSARHFKKIFLDLEITYRRGRSF